VCFFNQYIYAFTEAMTVLKLCCEQVLMRYTTNKTDAGIREYNTLGNIARDEDVAYAVYGEMLTDNADIFKFPMNRDVDALPIIEQCHSMLRTRFWTQNINSRSSDADDAEAGVPPRENTEPDRKLITLEAIMDYLKHGVEWKPLSVDRNRSDSNHVSRQEIVRVLKDFSSDMPLNILHDARFVSIDSNFCPALQAEPSIAKQKIDSDEANSYIQFDKLLETENEKAESNRVPGLFAYSMSGRTVGNIDSLCPCEIQDTNDIRSGHCKICSSICSIRNLATLASSQAEAEFDDFFPLCASYIAVDTELATTQSYPKHNITYVRGLLRNHGELLKSHGLVCPTYFPSDLWGIKPSHFSNQEYLNASYSHDTIHLSSLHALMHPKSGVSALNYQTVTQHINTVLGEDDREVRKAQMPLGHQTNVCSGLAQHRQMPLGCRSTTQQMPLGGGPKNQQIPLGGGPLTLPFL